MKNDIAALTEQLTSVLNDFADTAGKQARQGYKQARSNVDSMVSDWSDRGYEAAGAARDAAMSLEESLEDVIVERPLATVGIAMAIGFLIGSAWKR